MLRLYRVLTTLVYWGCYLYGKGRADRGDQMWKGRLGLAASPHPSDIWLHAASVGEVKVSSHLVNYLLRRNPNLKIHITTMTRTGFNTSLQLYSNPNVSVSFFPLDAHTPVHRTLQTVAPKMVTIAETEIWPNFISGARQHRIPVILVNGRMTDKAFRRYNRLKFALKPLFSAYERFFFKTDEDAERYRRLGIDSSRAVIAGDMKFDAPLADRSPDSREKIRQSLGVAADDFLFVAGSTRPGEEAIVADTFNRLTAESRKVIVVIAPRHVERADEIDALLKEKAISFRLYGDEQRTDSMILVDRLGVLNDLYLAADAAFVGGTLVDIGGHNILEPVWAGCPVLFGPSLHNVSEASQHIIENSYGTLVRSDDELVSMLKKIHSGDIMFQRKESRDVQKSPTAMIGEYILRRLSDV